MKQAFRKIRLSKANRARLDGAIKSLIDFPAYQAVVDAEEAQRAKLEKLMTDL